MEKLTKPVFVKVKSLSQGEDGYNVYVKVVSAEVTAEEGKLPIVKAVVADETAYANAFFKGENVNLIKKGEVIAIRNGQIKFIKNHISLEIDMFGRVTSEKVDLKENTDINISAEEIARKPRRNNRKFSGERNDRPPRRDNRETRGDDRRDDRKDDRRDDRKDDRWDNRRDNREPRENRRDNRQQRDDRRENKREDRTEGRREDRKLDRRQDRIENNGTRDQGELREFDRERRPKREFRNNEDRQERKPIQWTKIGAIEPGDDDLSILAQVISVKEVGKRLRVVIGDGTGTVNAFLYQNESLKEGNSIVIFRCEANVVKEHIELQLMERGKVEEARRKVDDVDRSVNVSAKQWIEAA